jgi:dihydroneopterin aldolase
MVLEVATSGKSRLLERVAAEILQALRRRWPSAKVTVELRKLLPPCPGNPSFTAVRLQS